MTDHWRFSTSAASPEYASGGYTQLHLLSLPTGTTVASWASPRDTGYSKLRVAGGGGLISYVVDLEPIRAQAVIEALPPPPTPVYRTSSSSSADIKEAPLLAPGGQLFAMAGTGNPPVTRIYQRTGGTLVTAVNGEGLVWMDDGPLLVLESVTTPSFHFELHLYDGTGASLGPGVTVATVGMGNVNVVGTDEVYSTAHNKIFSVTTGNAVWTASFPAQLQGKALDQYPRLGSVAGAYVVYLSGHEVIAERY